MENGIMVGILLAVVGVGLFGLYYASSPADYGGTVYVPITGMSLVEQGADNTHEQNNVLSYDVPFDYLNTEAAFTGDITDPTVFDSFGNCVGCTSYNITQSGYDANYGGQGQNRTICASILQESNTPINMSWKLNAALPTGWMRQRVNLAPKGTNTTPTGTVEYARDHWVNGSFDDTAGHYIDLTTGYQQMLGNWSDGTGVGNDNEYVASCEWAVHPQQVAAGTYTIQTTWYGQIA